MLNPAGGFKDCALVDEFLVAYDPLVLGWLSTL